MLTKEAWDSLHVAEMNYLEISGLSLAHNKVKLSEMLNFTSSSLIISSNCFNILLFQLTSIDTKLLSLKLHRAFRYVLFLYIAIANNVTIF